MMTPNKPEVWVELIGTEREGCALLGGEVGCSAVGTERTLSETGLALVGSEEEDDGEGEG